MKKFVLVIVLALSFAFGCEDAFALRIAFNIGGNTDAANNPSNFPAAEPSGHFAGEFVNNLDGAGLTTVVDSTNAATSVTAVGVTLANGSNGNDTDQVAVPVRATYGDAIGGSIFWTNGSVTTTIQGLTPSTDHAVGIVAAADGRNRTMDIDVNGSVTAMVNEQIMVTGPKYVLGTTDINGDLTVTLTNPSDAIGWQALVVDTDLTLVPEPGSIVLLLSAGFGIFALRRRR